MSIKKTKRTASFKFLLSDIELSMLKQLARENDRPAANYIRHLVREEYKKRKPRSTTG